MPVGNVSLTHIQEEKNLLGGRHARQLGFDPCQLAAQAPGIASEVKPIKGLSQNSSCQGGWVEPFHRPTANGEITPLSKTLNQIGALQLKSIPFRTCMSRKRHAEQLACLRIDKRLFSVSHTWRKPHPESRMAAIGEMTRSLSPVEGANGLEIGDSILCASPGEGVVSTGIQADEQDGIATKPSAVHA